ncbi:hypothetical protein LUZ61_016567 [Rhynchospora tenuis]|uniref:Uncharacterized protein n=1 Tax=Rhynchospora tenuis TaxID=198213 RepID=A0AAD5Z5S2_9POAL|nr:hypothetical protein LUZ61_016567 [Rhynchospora tenuis]
MHMAMESDRNRDNDRDSRDKNSSRAVVVERAHGLYREGKHEEALRLYSDALEEALKDLKDLELEEDSEEKKDKETSKNFKLKMIIALHSNRAACFLKMHRFRQAADECTAVLELDHDHTGALMLRAQTLVTLRDYQSALFDVNRLININPHSDIYHDLHARLKTQLSLAPIPESQEELEEEEQELEAEAEASAAALCQPQPHENQTQSQQLPQPHLNPKSAPSLQSDPPLPLPSKPDSPSPQINGWGTIPKPKGHSGLDYSRWDKVQDASSEDDSDDDDDDDDEAGQPQYRFRLRTVSMRPVK